MENLVFTQLSVPEIRQMFRQELETYFESNPQSNKTPTTPPAEQIFDVPLLSQYLGQAESTTYSNMPNYPRRKMGKSWRFLKSEIDEWLKSQKVKSKAEMKEDLRAEALKHLDNLKAKK